MLIAEGYATAASLHEATGRPVVVAFDAGNLMPVAETIRAKHPDVPLVFAADNDHHLPRRDRPLPNVGKEKAEAAAKAVGGVVVAPSFGDLEKQPMSEKTPPTDWNDYAAAKGQPAVRRAVESAVARSVETTVTQRLAHTEAQREAARRAAPQPSQAQAQQAAAHEAARAATRQSEGIKP